MNRSPGRDRRRLGAAAGLALALAMTAPEARAGQFWRLLHHDFSTPPPGPKRCIPHTHERAGFPQFLSPFAHPSNTEAYHGYYVGGGKAHGGDLRCAHEGTWGWDYVGFHFPRRVMLGWSHGRHTQSGTGYYQTDGPHVPDPIAGSVNVLRNHHGGGEGGEPGGSARRRVRPADP